MFCCSSKKEVDPNIYIPKGARIPAILQLCLAFSMVLWIAGSPFMQDLYEAKSKLAVFQTVMGEGDFIYRAAGKDQNRIEQLERNHERFWQLPMHEKAFILKKYEEIARDSNRDFIQKTAQAFQRLFFETPPLLLAWIFFGLILPILLLKRVDGAAQALWILPLLAISYAYLNDNAGVGKPKKEIFPSESYLWQNYIKEAPSRQIWEQKKQLEKGWQAYLIAEWSHPDSKTVEDGEFRFHLAHAKKIGSEDLNSSGKETGVNVFLLGAFVVWNLLFWASAIFSVREKKAAKCPFTAIKQLFVG